MQDGKTVDTDENIVKPFLPKSTRKIGNLPKLFFIDACRGKEDIDPVRGSGKETEPKVVERGVTEKQDSRVTPAPQCQNTSRMSCKEREVSG